MASKSEEKKVKNTTKKTDVKAEKKKVKKATEKKQVTKKSTSNKVEEKEQKQKVAGEKKRDKKTTDNKEVKKKTIKKEKKDQPKKENFIKSIFKEMKLVHFPSKKEMIKYSIATIIFIIFFGLLFYAVELIIAWLKMVV